MVAKPVLVRPVLTGVPTARLAAKPVLIRTHAAKPPGAALVRTAEPLAVTQVKRSLPSLTKRADVALRGWSRHEVSTSALRSLAAEVKVATVKAIGVGNAKLRRELAKVGQRLAVALRPQPAAHRKPRAHEPKAAARHAKAQQVKAVARHRSEVRALKPVTSPQAAKHHRVSTPAKAHKAIKPVKPAKTVRSVRH